MTAPQMMILGVLALTMGLFLWGRLRHDVVALSSLMACVVTGLVPAADAFVGFGHPAVITVACVLVLSQGLQNTGAVDALTRAVLPRQAGRFVSMIALLGLGAALSGFMNNVGAMALLMPVAMQLAKRLELPPGLVLMPLAFGTILGGMMTLVGTPPNLIVSGFRDAAGRGPFGMFDFAPVGVTVAVLGIAAIAAIGWRLVPRRTSARASEFDAGAYTTEVRVGEKSKAIGLTLRAFERDVESSDAQIVALVRNDVRLLAPHGGRIIREDDVLVLEADVEALAETLSVFDLTLEADIKKAKAPKTEEAETKTDAEAAEDPGSMDERDTVLRELAVLPSASIVGMSASDLHLRTRYGLNLLAVARGGQAPRARLRSIKLKSGDLLLMQGPAESLSEFIHDTGCVPLGERELRLPSRRMAITAAGIMGVAVVLVTFGVLPAAASFALGVLASMLFRTVPPRQVYTAIDWPVIVLLAALIPVAGAMQSTGAANLLAEFLVTHVAQGQAIAALAVILITTMFLSDVMNNAATAAVMCPIALGISASLGVSPDSFLMAVAIGASCAFLTPIGHQNNTLILGPGGFRFGDYWKLGLPLEILVVAISLPLLLIVWPL
ncbi:MAG: citrate transporter [Roseovarius sp. BRH_c41]|jgi:di/tricarboxylate transporter|uniref:SLC13 family permease n=1 Tax=Roseovarius sp. BRH_c41 TaxID=1629709 RepID=UPI0005F13A4D|nr:SLC13 family permease [Roseovarius sp. BRH_c41]KJS43679.1 MAG: citrate transporter [Roseovarius sp. BRH_c41]